MSVSYIKLLTIPMAIILKFGWTDELSIDTRMKGIWGLVGVSGGSGCNPEEYAVKGFLRSLALLEFRMQLAEERSLKTRHICPKNTKFKLFLPGDSGKYITDLQLMFAGNIGAALARAFSTVCHDESLIGEVRSVSLHRLHFFDALGVAGEDSSKFFRTLEADWRHINHLGVPRNGCRIYVTGATGLPSMLVTMTVSTETAPEKERTARAEKQK